MFLLTPIAPSSSPSDVTVTAASSTSLTLQWALLSAEEWNGDQRGFTISIVELESSQMMSVVVRTSASTSYTVSSLHPFYNYQCSIAAYNSAGTGPYSDTVSVMLPPDGETMSHACHMHVTCMHITTHMHVTTVMHNRITCHMCHMTCHMHISHMPATWPVT